MTQQSDERARWCAEFAAILVDETRMTKSDAVFLAEQAMVLSHGLPPTYAVRRALSDSHLRAQRVIAGRLLSPPHLARPMAVDDADAVGW